MPKYTVIGYYAEDNQTTADPIEAENGEEALRKAAHQRLGEYDQVEDTYERQGEFELVVAIEDRGEAMEGRGLTFPGDGMVEARDFIEPGWELEND